MDQTPDEIAQVLEDAADVLLVRGRCTGTGINRRDEYCVLGAIAAARGIDVRCVHETAIYEPHPSIDALADRVRPLVSAHKRRECGSAEAAERTPQAEVVWYWNDVLDHDDFEVIDTLRHVAKDLRAESDPFAEARRLDQQARDIAAEAIG